MRLSKRNRWLLGILLAVGLLSAFAAKPLIHLISHWGQEDEIAAIPAGFVDDASRQNRIRVAEIWPIPSDLATAERELAGLLRRAMDAGLAVSIAGARHSMGGQTLHPGGISIDMLPLDHLSLDSGAGLLTAGAGALWRDVIPFLDAEGWSVAVMQSNDSFSVGGSISVNCHGWPFREAPIASTVESFRLMTADGTIHACSREENPELFSLALGGYGLFGVILDVVLRVVPNERYRFEQYLVPLAECLPTIDREIEGRPEVRLAYARLNVTSDRLLGEALINIFSREEGEIPPLSDEALVPLRRAIFRGSVASEYGKEVRWNAETRLQPLLARRAYSRNQLLHEGVEVYQNRSADSVDILAEYFVPMEEVGAFTDRAREIIREHGVDLLNVTVRDVREDTDTFLRYADRRLFAFVMLFHQRLDESGESRMRAMDRALIDAAIECGGRYYLPYRLHATPEQFQRAYPQAAEFFARKRHYDPGELFQNAFYREYGLAP